MKDIRTEALYVTYKKFSYHILTTHLAFINFPYFESCISLSEGQIEDVIFMTASR